MLPLYTNNDTLRASTRPGVNNNEPGRSAYRKDYARLLHAPSFRRLQGKTQLFPGSESDFFRNRLTHSLEVAQIAAGIAEMLNVTTVEKMGLEPVNTDLVQFASIAHDLGHPPFGHNGEQALDALMRKHGGFEGNAQTLRILTTMEKKLIKVGGDLSDRYGLDLTYRTLASVLKYDNQIPTSREPGEGFSKGYYSTEKELVREIKKNVAPKFDGEKFKTIECAIMDIADDIAYSTYDLEDSLHAGFVTPTSLIQALSRDDNAIQVQVLNKTNAALKENEYPEIDGAEMFERTLQILGVETLVELDEAYTEMMKDEGENRLHRAGFRAMNVAKFDDDLARDDLTRTRFTAERIGRLISQVKFFYNEQNPALSTVKLSREALLDVEILKHLNYALVIRSPRLAIVQYRGKDIVTQLFNAIIQSDGDLLSGSWKQDYMRTDNSTVQHRVVCDFISGMTDNYAVEYHNALFGNGTNLYKPL